MARNEVTVNVQLDDKQLKSLADEIRETFAKRIDELESRIAKVREIAEGAEVKGSIGCFCRGNEHNPASELCWQPVAWSIDPAELLAVLDGCGKADCTEQRSHEHVAIDDLGDSTEDAAYDKGGADA